MSQNKRLRVLSGVLILSMVCSLLVFPVSTNAASKTSFKNTKTTIKSVSCDKTKSATIKWKKVNNASGYIIYRSTSKNGTYKKIKTIKNGKTLTFTNKDLKGNKAYFYKVRAYKKSNSKTIYNKYSAVKRVYVYKYKKGIIRKKVVDYYTKLWKPDGKYVCFSSEDFEWNGNYGFILRYQMSDKLAEERLEQGLSVYPNTLVTGVYVNKKTGVVTDDYGNEWKMKLP